MLASLGSSITTGVIGAVVVAVKTPLPWPTFNKFGSKSAAVTPAKSVFATVVKIADAPLLEFKITLKSLPI
ncbi:hypothetical protein D3C85_1350770 [compost metagenome]